MIFWGRWGIGAERTELCIPHARKARLACVFAFGYFALLVRMKREDDRQTAAVPGEPGNVASQAYE